NDVAFLDALGTRSIPDPTTAGDFCRRFQPDNTQLLMDIINDVRVQILKKQAPAFFEGTSRIDAAGTLVSTTRECKEGMDLSYNGFWGYHPLVVSLANTGEPLFIVNRSGNAPPTRVRQSTSRVRSSSAIVPDGRTFCSAATRTSRKRVTSLAGIKRVC